MENEQITVILKNEGLNAAQFAERIGIQRSAVSHLLSNRNKVSLDIVKKVHKAFPAISLNWLLDAEGDYWIPGYRPAEPNADQGLPADREPLAVQENAVSSPLSADSGMGSLFDDVDDATSEPKSSAYGTGTALPLAEEHKPEAPLPAENAKIAAVDTETTVFCKEKEDNKYVPATEIKENQARISIERPSRRILEIKVFYDDGTYETYFKQ